MEDQPQVSRKSIMLNYGLLLGFVSIITAIVNYGCGEINQTHLSLMVASLEITTIIIVNGQKKVKEMNCV